MKVALFSAKNYDKCSFASINEGYQHELTFFEPRLTVETASLARGFPTVCVFINDELTADTLRSIADGGTRLIALRCAGYNNVDLAAAKTLGLQVVRVPAYSPHAVAEHAAALILTLNRKLYKAYNRVREGNFSLEGLLGFDLYGKTVGVVGTGQIGECFALIMHGFGCRLLAYDIEENLSLKEMGTEYVAFNRLLNQSDIISLHCPLLPATHHMINQESLQQLKHGAMLINTSRGGLVDTQAVIDALKSSQLGALGVDVYEDEGSLFFQDLSNAIVQDDIFQVLKSFPNVVITAHQGFFTQEALHNIACTTLANIRDIEAGKFCINAVEW
ncbi:MAG: 2-hydroxyacid dehydrogenase [Cyanobacteria bacterium P01_D01_bin.36]